MPYVSGFALLFASMIEILYLSWYHNHIKQNRKITKLTQTSKEKTTIAELQRTATPSLPALYYRQCLNPRAIMRGVKNGGRLVGKAHRVIGVYTYRHAAFVWMSAKEKCRVCRKKSRLNLQHSNERQSNIPHTRVEILGRLIRHGNEADSCALRRHN